MRIIFVGTVDFSRHCLEEVLANGGNIVAVLTLAEENAGFHSDYADLSEVSAQHGIPVYELEGNITASENVELIRSLEPDVIFVFGWSQLISRAILDIPPQGCIGTHPTLLPKGRGRHPLIWALVKGLKRSGLTFFYIDEGTDTGDILWQKSFRITLQDNAATLYAKIKSLASEAIREFLPQLEQGTAPRIPQDDNQATYWRKRTEKDGEIDWAAPTIGIYNLIRALTHPYVGAHTYIKGRKVVIWHARIPSTPLPSEAVGLKPGVVFDQYDERLLIRTGDGYLIVLEYEVEEGALHTGVQLGASL
jgi:methionyl-tRNA formyltransferase